MPEMCDALIYSLEVRPEAELTLEYVKGKLLYEYHHKREIAADTATRAEEINSALKVNEENKQKTSDNCSVFSFCV